MLKSVITGHQRNFLNKGTLYTCFYTEVKFNSDKKKHKESTLKKNFKISGKLLIIFKVDILLCSLVYKIYSHNTVNS